MKLTKIWFEGDFICGLDEENKEYRQSLLWYPRLLEASDEERQKYTFGFCGIHWRGLNEDISFESFLYPDATPNELQEFFLKQERKRETMLSGEIFTKERFAQVQLSHLFLSVLS